MARPPPPSLFLARASYRQRRLRDALRLLPVLGAILMMLPLLWPRGVDGHGTAQVLIYLFTVWTLLILGAFLLTRRLRPDDAEAPGASDPEDP